MEKEEGRGGESRPVREFYDIDFFKDMNDTVDVMDNQGNHQAHNQVNSQLEK